MLWNWLEYYLPTKNSPMAFLRYPMARVEVWLEKRLMWPELIYSRVKLNSFFICFKSFKCLKFKKSLDAIKAKFGQEDEDYDIEAQWVKTRNLLNKKIPKIRPIVNGSSVISQLKVKKEPDTLKVKLNIKKKNKSD